jgi:hypothetical protein
MSEIQARHPVTLKPIVHPVAGAEGIQVTRDVAYGDDLRLDVFHPRRMADDPAPAVIIVAGYRDVGVPLTLGCHFKEMYFVVSLAQLIALSGMAAIAYSTSSPARDAGAVVDFLASGGAGLGINPDRLGIWGSSGNVPVALALLMERRPVVRAAVLSNGFMFDAPGGTAVADAAATYRFVNATAGRSVRDLPSDVPLFVVRSGRDEFPGLNETLDRFVADALRENIPVTIVNHATAPHGFEVSDDTAISRHILDATMSFLRLHLGQRA